jgi:hypothetical protein
VHHSSRRVSPKPWTSREYFRPFVVWVGAIALFALPLFKHGPRPAAIPAVCGISALLAVVLLKRLASGMAGVLFAVALVVCGLWLAGLTTGIVGLPSSEVLGSHSETEIATVVRVFHDFRSFGSGIGTYSRVVPMYADLQDGGKGLFDSPTALSLLIELGMPLALLAAALLLALAWAVFSMVARNDRDYSHAMLACSTLVYVVAAAFTPGLSLSFSTMVVASMIIGLGLTATQRPLGTGPSHSRSTVRPRSTSEHVGSSRSKADADVPLGRPPRPKACDSLHWPDSRAPMQIIALDRRRARRFKSQERTYFFRRRSDTTESSPPKPSVGKCARIVSNG